MSRYYNKSDGSFRKNTRESKIAKQNVAIKIFMILSLLLILAFVAYFGYKTVIANTVVAPASVETTEEEQSMITGSLSAETNSSLPTTFGSGTSETYTYSFIIEEE